MIAYDVLRQLSGGWASESMISCLVQEVNKYHACDLRWIVFPIVAGRVSKDLANPFRSSNLLIQLPVLPQVMTQWAMRLVPLQLARIKRSNNVLCGLTPSEWRGPAHEFSLFLGAMEIGRATFKICVSLSSGARPTAARSPKSPTTRAASDYLQEHRMISSKTRNWSSSPNKNSKAKI